jgi:hypothetical protein
MTLRGPVYPILVDNVFNDSRAYFVKFAIQLYPPVSGCNPFPVSNIAQTAWLDTVNITIGGPVTLLLDNNTLPQNAGPTPKVETLVVGAGDPIPTTLTAPITFWVFGAYNSVTAEFGWDEDTDGMLLYNEPPPTPHPNATNTNFLLTPPPTISTKFLKTGYKNTVTSKNGRALRAIPTVDPTKFTLAWKPMASAEGFAVVNITIFSSAPCKDCYL